MPLDPEQTQASGTDLMPGVAQVVSVGVCHGDEGLDGVDVFLLHLGYAGAGREQGEAGQGLDVGIPLQLSIEAERSQRQTQSYARYKQPHRQTQTDRQTDKSWT